MFALYKGNEKKYTQRVLETVALTCGGTGGAQARALLPGAGGVEASSRERVHSGQ